MLFILFFCSLLNNAAGFKEKYLSWKSWHKWCIDIINNIKSSNHPLYTGTEDENGESPAVEVLKFKDPEGYFAGKLFFVAAAKQSAI